MSGRLSPPVRCRMNLSRVRILAPVPPRLPRLALPSLIQIRSPSVLRNSEPCSTSCSESAVQGAARRLTTVWCMGSPPLRSPKPLPFWLGAASPKLLRWVFELLDRWAQDDPAAAMTYARSLGHTPQRAKATAMVLEEWVASNPVGAINWLSALPPTKDKEQWLNTSFAYIGFWDPTNALAMCTALDASQAFKGRLRATILARWAERDGPGAAAALLNMSGLPPAVYGDVASAWAVQDPKLALAWAASLTSTQARNIATRRAAEAWGGVDGQAAADYFLAQSADTRQTAILSSLLSRWASDDPSAVMSWVANLPDAAARARLLPGLASACAKVDPLSVSPYLQSLPANMQEDVARRIAGALFEQDSQQGADFVASLPAGEIQSTAQRSLARQWASQDLSGALAWLGQLPQGAGRDAALDGLLPEWTRNDPAAAAAYVHKKGSVNEIVLFC